MKGEIKFMEFIGMLTGVGSYVCLGFMAYEIIKLGVKKNKENKKK